MYLYLALSPFGTVRGKGETGEQFDLARND